MKQLGAKLGKAPLLEEERQTKALGVYPYFRPISSDQDAEVTINGKKVLMFGSNSYLGLTNHPKVKVRNRLCRQSVSERIHGYSR